MGFMSTLFSRLRVGFDTYVIDSFRNIKPIDVIDILLLAALLYGIYRFVKNRRAGRVVAGLVVIIFVGALAVFFRLPALSFIVKMFASAFFFCIVLIFQPEIRTALEHIGNFGLANPSGDTMPKRKFPLAKQVAEATVEAVYKMSDSCTGALIVFEGTTKLGDCIETGKVVDARVTSHMLQNIFFDKAPLHDGALIIRDFRIHAASCVLPSTSSTMDFGNLGTRHRAAVGVTEISDALVVVVSEQTGIVSVAQDGRLLRGVDRDTLLDILMTYLAGKLYLRTKRDLEDLEDDEDDFDWFEKGNVTLVASATEPSEPETEEEQQVADSPENESETANDRALN